MSFWSKLIDAGNPLKNNLDPGQAFAANLLGLHNTYATMIPGGLTPWNAWKSVKQDWSTFKHWVVPDTRRDRELMVNTSQGSRRLVYGKVRVSGQIVFAETSNGSATLHLVIVLAGHPCTLATRTEGGIEKDDIYLDEKKIETLVSQGIVTYTYYDGTQTTADAGLIAACPSWTSAHKLLGCSYLILNLTYAENAWPSGIPTPKVVLKGFEVYDPRDESTAWSDNPALCIRHYMLLPVADGGMGCASSEVDDASVIAAADICDEMVVSDGIGGTEKRYTCNGTVTLEQTPAAILSRMIDSMAGRYNYIQGKWQIFAGAYSTPRSEPLDESYLNGGIKINIGANKNSLLNTVKGSFVDPGNQWAVTDFPVVTIPAYVSDDGEELDGSLQLDFTASPTMAQRLAKLTLERSRRGTTVEYPCNLKAFDVAYNDVVKVNNTLMGWSERIFRVIDWQGGVTGGIVLTLQEDDANIYNWVVGDITPITPPDPTTLFDPWIVPTPTGLNVTEELYTTNVPSEVKCRAILTWDSAGNGLRYEISLDGTAIVDTTDTAYIFNDIAPGTHSFSVRAVHSNAKSVPATLSAAIDGKTAVPDEVDSFTVTTLGDGTRRLAWAMATPPLDLAGFRIRYVAGGSGSWGGMTPLHTGLLLASPFETAQLVGGVYTFAIVTEDTSGNQSDAIMTTVTLGTGPGDYTPVAHSHSYDSEVTAPSDSFIDLGSTSGETFGYPVHISGSLYVKKADAVDCKVQIYRGFPGSSVLVYEGPAIPVSTAYTNIAFSFSEAPPIDSSTIYRLFITSTAGTTNPFTARNAAIQMVVYRK